METVGFANVGRHARETRQDGRVVDAVGKKVIGDVPNVLGNGGRAKTKDDLLGIRLLHNELRSGREGEVGLRLHLGSKAKMGEVSGARMAAPFDDCHEPIFDRTFQRDDLGE